MTHSELRIRASPRPKDRFRDSVVDLAQTRMIDAVLMGGFVVVMLIPGTSVGVHLVSAVLLVIVAAFRKPTRTFEGVKWYLFISGALVAYLGLSSLLDGLEPADISRLGRIALLMAVAGFMASGRIDIRSGLRGIAVALVANVPLFYAGVVPDNYDGLLTGILGDKNLSGFAYATFTILLLVLADKLWTRILILAGGAACVVLTDSRTAMAALAAGVIWLLASKYLGTFFKALLAVGIYLAFDFAETNLAQSGEYVRRQGSDALRERIDAASLEKVNAAPWNGVGLGEAQVTVAGDSWFFHNAYWGLLAEGGYPLLIGVLAIVALAGFQLFAKGPATSISRIVEASTVVLLLCSVRLGETFFALPGFVLVGLGLVVCIDRFDREQQRLAEESKHTFEHAVLSPR